MFRQRDLFNILVYERRLRYRDLRNKFKLVRGFYTGDLVVVRENVNSSIKDRIDQQLLFKTKVTRGVLEKAIPSSYWLQNLPFCEGLGSLEEKCRNKRPGWKRYHPPWCYTSM